MFLGRKGVSLSKGLMKKGKKFFTLFRVIFKFKYFAHKSTLKLKNQRFLWIQRGEILSEIKSLRLFYTACKIILATLRIPTKFCELME